MNSGWLLWRIAVLFAGRMKPSSGGGYVMTVDFIDCDE
jgi:hypothetical protein